MAFIPSRLSHTRLSVINACNGFIAVGLGAMGAHALKPRLLARGTWDAWQSASLYHISHVVGSLALLSWAESVPQKATGLTRVVSLWQLGCLLFSGSIYVLALGGPKFLGPATPLGGLAFLTGWGLLIGAAVRRPKSS